MMMDAKQTVKKAICNIPGYELFADYYVDVLGNIWSYKGKRPKILKPSWMNKNRDYRFVTLRTCDTGMRKHIGVHRLVAMAFMPVENFENRHVRHKNKNNADNRLENLTWTRRPRGSKRDRIKNRRQKVNQRLKAKIEVLEEEIRNPKDKRVVKAVELGLKDNIVNKMEKVLMAANMKGLPVATSTQFFNKMVDDALEDFIRQYGLRKVMEIN